MTATEKALAKLRELRRQGYDVMVEWPAGLPVFVTVKSEDFVVYRIGRTLLEAVESAEQRTAELRQAERPV